MEEVRLRIDRLRGSAGGARPAGGLAVAAAAAVAVVVAMACGAAPAFAQVPEGGGVRILPLLSTSGQWTATADGALVAAGGESSALGLSGDPTGGLGHFGGWVMLNPAVRDPDPLRLEDVRIEAVTPDSAIVTFTTSHPATARAAWGTTDGYGQAGGGLVPGVLRMAGLEAGRQHHFRLTVRDERGRERSTRDLTFCTPGPDEISRGFVRADYYRGIDFNEHALTRSETSINQPLLSDNNVQGDFGTGIGRDNFSVRWTGMINITRDARYSFAVRGDDGYRLHIDGVRRVNRWQVSNPTTGGATVALSPGWHAIKHEMFSALGAAYARVQISGGDIRPAALPSARLAHVTEEFYRPAFVPRDEPVELECDSPAGARAFLSNPEMQDCHDPMVRPTRDAVDSFALGENRVVWSATNNLGYSARYVEFVTVVDTSPPALGAPVDVRVEARSPAGTVVALPRPAVADRCDAGPVLSYELCGDCKACWTAQDEAENAGRVAGARNRACACAPVPARFPLGQTSVTVLATDASGNCTSAGFDVEVVDTTAPVIEVGDPVLAQCSEFRIPPIAVRDNGTPTEDLVLTCRTAADPGPGPCDRRVDLGFGMHTIAVTAEDAAGNLAVGEVVVAVSQGNDTAAPDVTIVESPTGWITGPATVVARVVDECDATPDVEFDPAPDTREDDGELHTVDYEGEDVYVVTVTGADDNANPARVQAPAFGIDATAPEAEFPGLDEPEDVEDRDTWPALFAGDVVSFSARASDTDGGAHSGVARLLAVLDHLDSDRSRVVLDASFDLDDEAPPAGPSRVKNVRCADVVPGRQVSWCTADGDLSAADLDQGGWRLTVTAWDVAGNTHSTERLFTRMDWTLALERAAAVAERLLDAGVDAVTELFLQEIVDNLDAAIASAQDGTLHGDALLYTYSFVSALVFAGDQGEEVGDTAEWLTQAAYDAVDARRDAAADDPGADADDLAAAADHLAVAADDLAAAPLAAILSMENAFFRLEHAVRPYVIEEWADNEPAAARLSARLGERLANPAAHGAEHVRAIRDVLGTILAEGLFVQANDRRNAGVANVAFIKLHVRLNDIADRMADAQDDWVWVRNWQWPVALLVRSVGGRGIQGAGVQLREADPANPVDPLLAYADGLYDEGLGLIAERLLDDALEMYVDNRCLIFEVYNHAGMAPAGVPPVGWECPACVLTGDCEH